MSHFLLAWELGLNFGHLARLYPLACALRARGHRVTVAARDMAAAQSIFVPRGIDILPAPHLLHPALTVAPPVGYAGILLSHGWGDPNVLRMLVGAWQRLFAAVRPDRVVLDHAPTAALAARAAGLPAIWIGNGFELPPPTSPLPPFIGFSGSVEDRAAQTESQVLANAKAAVWVPGSRILEGLRDLFDPGRSLLTTFRELDHYGERAGACYVGFFGVQRQVATMGWPPGNGPRVFACVRPDTPQVDVLVSGLQRSGARVVCVALGFSIGRRPDWATSALCVVEQPVDLSPLLKEADACVTYGAEGTMIAFLLEGVPQLIVPRTVEAQLAARRLEDLGVGLALRGQFMESNVTLMLNRLLYDGHYRSRARAFATAYCAFDSSQAVAAAIARIEADMSCPSTAAPFPLMEPAAALKKENE